METATTSSADLPGFEEVNLDDLSEETLTFEDSRKKELWLVKVPHEFDVSTLADTTVILNGTQDLPTKKGDQGPSKRYETRAAKYDVKQPCPFEVLLPSSKNDNHLKIARGFAGHLDITQTIPVPMLVYPEPEPPKYTDIPKGLKERWKPFGHETPRVRAKSKREDHFPSKKKKYKTPKKRNESKSKEDVQDGYSSAEEKKATKEAKKQPENEKKEKSKKERSPKKKKNKQDSVFSEPEVKIEENSLTSSPKKKRKKKSREVTQQHIGRKTSL